MLVIITLVENSPAHKPPPPPEPQFDWKLTNVEIYTLVIRLAKNGAITDSSALIKILKRATDLPNHLLKNMRSELFTSIASTARTWDNVTEKNDISSILKNEITKTHRPGHSDKHSSIFTCWSEEFFSFIRLFLTNQGLPIAQDVITILKYLHTQRIGFFSE